jgi:hypothetical protein
MIVAPPSRALSSPQQRPVFTGLVAGPLFIGMGDLDEKID